MFNEDRVYIFAPMANQKINYGGLCGRWNNNRNDDFAIRSGATTTQADDFIKSWQGSCYNSVNDLMNVWQMS